MNDNSRSIVGFTMVSHAMVHVYELSIPILMVSWLAEFPVTTALLGPVVAVGYGLFGVGALPSGLLVDRFSSRRMITIGIAGMSVSFLLLSLSPGVVTIALALAVWGVCASVHHPAALTLISTGVDDRGTGFAYHGMAGNVGIAFGPLATAVLLLAFDWRLVAALLAVPAIAAVAYALTAEFDEMAAVTTDGGTADRSSGSPGSLSEFLADSRHLFTIGFAIALAVVIANGLFYRGLLTFLPDMLGSFVSDLGALEGLLGIDGTAGDQFEPASYVYAGLLTVGVGGQYVGGKLTDRIPITTGLAAVFVGLAAIAVLFVPAASLGLWPTLAVSAVLGFLLFAIQPLYQAMIAEYSPPGDRGLSYGYTYLANFGVGATGAAVAGFLLATVAVEGTFLVLAAFPLVGAALAVVLSRVGEPRDDA